jgi:hypothetical protein
MRRRFRAATLLAVLAATAGCRDGSGRWSADERRQIEAFTASVVKAEEAGPAASADRAKGVEALKAALDASNTVSDEVLARIHPQLPDRYRTRFVLAVRMRLDSLNALGAGDEMTGKHLEWQLPMSDWGNWYDRNLPELRRNIQ